DSDVTTPVPLDVVDTNATAALRLIKSQQFPSIFRSLPETTNTMTRDFLAAFTEARTNFLADLAIEFHSATLDEAAIASADFGRLVTVFGVENKNFPVTDELAAEWARGGDGTAIRNKLLATLQWTANRPVRPDTLPQGMFIGETIRLVPVTDTNQKLSFETVQQGRLIPAADVTTVSNAQALFRREFPASQQLFARALAAFLQPNCFPDEPFTQLTRGSAVYKLVVSDHFDAGDTIVRRGDMIDAKTLAAMEGLESQLRASPTVTPVTAANTLPQAQPESPPATPTPKLAPAVMAQSAVSAPPRPVPQTGLRHIGLIITLAGISVASLLVAWWQYSKEKKRATLSALVAQVPLPLADIAKPDLAPQVALAVREAVQRELALQRRELLVAQQAATDEIAALVQRLDELQMPMQERLHTYETRIQSLEKELSVRNEENRELLKLKIEMISRQLQTERAATLVPPIIPNTNFQ
ncbi:MAG TPA: hypothetical protein VH251_07605, partial [Verrucomicrobiae bacterium]|nr:hypothetical protein [Verrucomicrobiae bacterium]